MNTRHLFQKIGIAGAITLAAASCAQDDLTGGRGTNGNAIGFGITTLAENTAEGRASEADDKPIVLPFPGGRDTLYLHPWAEENRSVPSAPQKGETRGVPVTTEEDFKDVCGSFGVTAYTDDGRLFMQDVEVTSASGSLWAPSETYFWPAEATLDFYAYAPYSGYGYGYSITEKKITFDYTVPDKATEQPDILFAHKACSKASEGGTVELTFRHALAGVKFVAKNVTGCTVKRITLKGLYGQGSCTYVTDDTGKGTFAWTPSGEKRDFSEEFNVTLKDSEGETAQPITDVKEETTFMLIPQTLEGVTVEVEVETDGETFTLTGSLAQTGAWEAGKIYIYAISTESINWEYVFEVTPNNSNEVMPDITFELGETQKTYTVTSYRYRKGNHEKKEPVAWSAANKSFSETDQETGSEVTGITLGDVLQTFTYSDDTPSESEDYTIGLTETTLKTTYEGDLTLKNAQPKGSPENPYDLSTHDENGGTIAQTTANCYVVSSAGTYQLPLVYGNAIKNGAENAAAYQGGQFNDYLDRTISNSQITGADDAVLVWSDGFFMFKDIKLSNDKKYLVFTIDPDYMQQANAVLAVRDAQDRIMWSWHIWVTERPVYTQIHTLTDLFDQNNKYGMMQCNLGWVDGKMVYYNRRDLTFNFTQTGSGNTDQLTVVQEGAQFDYKDVGSTYYQWGRKDPLVALRNWDSYRFEDYRLHETGDPKYVYCTATGPASFGTAIQNPNVFYTRGGNAGTDWNGEHVATLWNTRDGGGQLASTVSTKTIYDPSPRGFKVPVPRAFAVFVNGGTSTTTGGTLNGYRFEDDLHNKYRVYPQPNRGGTEIPLTATGQRADRAGLEAYLPGDGRGEVGGLWSLYGVYYWTCVHEQNHTGVNTNAYTLVIRNDYPSGIEVYSYGFVGAKTMARPVRPILDDR